MAVRKSFFWMPDRRYAPSGMTIKTSERLGAPLWLIAQAD